MAEVNPLESDRVRVENLGRIWRVTGEQEGRILVCIPADREETAVELSVAVEQELAQVVIRAIRAEVGGLGGRDEVELSEIEGAVRGALRQVGRECLELVVGAVGTGYVGPTRPCECGGEQKTDHYATATWQTVLGEVAIRRAAYRCEQCQARALPLDEQLGLSGERTSPHLRALISRYCAAVSFAEVEVLLQEAIGVEIAPKRAQLVSEAVGQKLAERQAAETGETPGEEVPRRLYLGIDGVFYCTTERDPNGALVWREAKVAILYAPLPRGAPRARQHSHLAPDGPPLDAADPSSYRYVAHMGDWAGFAAKLWRELVRFGIEHSVEVVVLSDGAEWIEQVRALLLDGLGARVVHILDLRHAEEHLWDAAKVCLGDEAPIWIADPLEHLRQGRIDDLLAALRSLPTPTDEAAKLVPTTLAYFDKRRTMLDYPRFRAQGYQIGSGLAESACKRLITQREKGPGMHWTTPGAQAIATLRAAHLVNCWDEVLHVAKVA